MSCKGTMSNTVKISSRTSVQSEPVITSDGAPVIKYKTVLKSKEEKNEEGKIHVPATGDFIDKPNAEIVLPDTEVFTGELEEINKILDTEVFTDELDVVDKLKETEVFTDESDTSNLKAFADEIEEENKVSNTKVGTDGPKAEIKWRRITEDKDQVAKPKTLTRTEKGMECGFCEQDQISPKLLPCLHSFCRECLEKLVCVRNGRQWIKCPLCKAKINLSAKGIEEFEDNVYIQFSNESVTDDSVCDMCQNQQPSCRCLDCRTNLCTDCAGIHMRSLPERNHSIVKVTQEMMGKPPEDNVCDIHRPFTLDLFCITCSEPVCGRCAIDKHLNHVTEDTTVCAKERRKTLMGIVNDSLTKRLLRDLRESLISNRKDKARLVLDIGRVTEEIDQYMETLKTEINNMGRKLIDDLKGSEEAWLSSLDRKYQDAESKQRSVEQVINVARRITERTGDIDFLKRHGRLKTLIQNIKKFSQPIQQTVRCEFVPLLKLGPLGRVQMTASLNKAIEFYDLGKASFQKRISCICPTSGSNAWIGYGKTLQLCHKAGTLGIQIDMGDFVISIAENSFETAFVACKTSVKAIGSKLVPKKCFHLPHEPSSIAFTEDDNLVICYKEARRVSIHSTKGKVLKELDVRHFGYRFGARITDPWRIAVNENQDILVADYSSENIAIFENYGEIKSTFRCNVYRRAIICCDQGLVYVADQRKDQVYVFSEKGQLLQTIRAEGISGLWSMAIDGAGNLWLGSWHGAVKIYGRK